MTSTVIYEGELRTTCRHLASGSGIETDAPTDNQGKGERFSPTDLLATSLATCMLTVMGIKARSMGVQMEGMSADVKKIMLSEPRRVGGIHINVRIPGQLEGLDERSKKILIQTGLTCPVIHSLHPEIDVQISWGAWEGSDQ